MYSEVEPNIVNVFLKVDFAINNLTIKEDISKAS